MTTDRASQGGRDFDEASIQEASLLLKDSTRRDLLSEASSIEGPCSPTPGLRGSQGKSAHHPLFLLPPPPISI